jgi:adenylate cyclase
MSTEKVKRKLTAILSADVKGYSRLMGADEVGTIRILQTYRQVMSDLIQKKGGRVVDSPGDNVLAEFASVVDALESAVEIQRELKVRNTDRSESRRMEFRIGINLGDVVEEGERIYGDGVNIAARIEGLAEGGGICISGTAFDQIGKRLPLGYEYMGEQAVKNIEKPVRVYRVLMEPEQAGKVIGESGGKGRRWRWAAAAAVVLVAGALGLWNFYFRPPATEPASKEKMAFPLPDKPSIAVLAFTNLSGDAKDDLLGDGLSEGIINGLSKSDRVFVIARNSSFTYKGKPIKVKQVAEEMGVRYVIEGSIQREGERVRITVQLIDSLTGNHLFSERYDRDLKGILNLQDEITMKVLTAVRVKLTSGELARIYEKGTKNLDAYLKVLEAAEHKGGTVNKERVQRASQLLEEAIALDPEYASAYSILSTAYFDLVILGASESPRESLRRAVELGKKAIALDESNGTAHANLAFPYVYLREFDKAIEEAEKGVSLSPNSASGYWALGTALYSAGRPQEAIPFLQKSLRLSPIPIHSQVLGVLAGAYGALGQYEEAIATYKKVLQIYGPDHMMAHLGLAATYALMGRENEARAEGAEVLRIDPKFSWERWIRVLPFDQSRKDRLTEALNRAGLSDKPPLPLPDKPSIAVLPFVNMSDDKGQEYFSDGLTEDLITDLSKISGLFVIARNSTFVYKGKSVNVQQVSRELGVKYVLEGSVRRAGDQVRINAQLIDATSAQHLWAERYDGSMRDVFSLQDKINQKIVAALAVKLTADEKAQVGKKETNNLAAYEEFLKGREHYLKFTVEDLAKAMTCFKRAIELDPNYRRARAALALLYYNIAARGPIMQDALKINYGEARLRARQYLMNAMEEPISVTYMLSGLMNLTLRQWDEAISQFEKALALDPNDPLLYVGLTWVLSMSGRPAEGMEYAKSGMRLDPLNPARYLAQIGVAHFCMGEWQEAVTPSEQALKLNPEEGIWAAVLASAYAHLGRTEEAKAAYQVCRQRVGTDLSLYFWPFKDSRVEESFVEGLIKAGWSGGRFVSVHVSKKDQITGEHLKQFYYPSTTIGYGIGSWQMSQEFAEDGTVTMSAAGLPGGVDTGRSWLEDKICIQFQKYSAGLAFCRTTFRNPRGTPQGNDEYLGFSDLASTTFSRAQ